MEPDDKIYLGVFNRVAFINRYSFIIASDKRGPIFSGTAMTYWGAKLKGRIMFKKYLGMVRRREFITEPISDDLLLEVFHDRQGS